MAHLSSDVLFSSDLWTRALDSYARAANLTVKLFDADARVVGRPVHPTPVFQLLEETSRYDPGIFSECARDCLAQSESRPAIIVSEYFGLSVVGTSLVLDDQIVGAAVAGYAFVDFSQISEVQCLARNAGLTFERLWLVAREQKPVPKRRLMLNGELLQVLGDALLRENSRTRRYGTALIQSETQLRALASRLLTSQEDERRRLARELHDDTLQRIASLQNDVELVRRDLSGKNSALNGQLQDVQEKLEVISTDIRNFSHTLHPAILDDLGLEVALRHLVRDFETNTSQTIAFKVNKRPGTIPSDIATALYRIVQEALGNIRKHAPRASATVTLATSSDELRLLIEDNGPGFTANGSREPGLGLVSMQERAKAVGGEAIVASGKDRGTRIEVIVPFRENA